MSVMKWLGDVRFPAITGAVVFFLLIGSGPLAASSGGLTDPKTAPEEPREKPKTDNCTFNCGSGQRTLSLGKPKGSRGWDFFFGLVAVADSNIDRNIDENSDYGFVPTFGIGWVSVNPSRKFEFRYEGAQHEYVNTDSWDRYSQKISGLFEPKLHGRWGYQTIAEATIKGSSEDRDLSDRYSLLQRIDFDLNKHQSLRLYGAWRVRANNADPGHDSDNPYAGVAFKHKLDKHHKLTLDYRYEDNRTNVARNSYRRSTLEFKYEAELGANDELTVETRYRDQYYYDRLIVVNDALEYRQDDRWFVDLYWMHRLSEHWELSLAFGYENRASNDPDKEYDAKELETALVYRW